MHTTTNTEDPMTDQTTLDRLIADAEADLTAAHRWAATTDLHAPVAVKAKDQQRIRRARIERARIERARIELEALRELVAEA